MSESSQIVTRPSWRCSFSNRSAGFEVYSLVWASRRRSHSKPFSGEPVSATERASDHREHGAQRAAGQRVAHQDLPAPARREEVVPVARRLRLRHRGGVVDQDRQRAVGAEVEVVRAVALRRRRRRPLGAEGLEQPVRGAAREDRVRPAEPDVGLRVGALRAHPVVDLLRPHVEPAHVDLGPRGFVGALERAQEIAPVRRVDDDRRAAVTAGGGDRAGRRQRPAAAHCPRARRFANSRYAPGTPAGSWRKKASPV